MKTRKELAKILKKRQLKLLPITAPQFGITKEKIEKMSGDEIIESYITCSECGEKFATLEDIDRVLQEKPKTFEEFWTLLENLVKTKDIASHFRVRGENV